ncbi:Slp family lipoprotein [Thermodesulfovibrio hydrogeniphilus]
MRRFVLGIVILFLLAGCATLPKPLRDIPAEKHISLAQIKNNPSRYTDVVLLWGGRITNCSNAQDGTYIEILYLPLDNEGYPQEKDVSEGRFVVKSKNFLDCAIYSKGRYLTAVGQFKGFLEGKIDEMPYSFPFLEAKAIYLWKKRYYYPYIRPSIWFWYGSPRWWFEYGPWW